MQNNVTILTERTKALKTPARFIGSVETQEVNKLIVTEDLKSVTEKTINFNQGLFKIVEEVFDNALDECKRHRNNADSKKKGIGNVVSFQIDPQCQWITVSDNGNGIPTTKAKLEDGSDSDMTMYQAAWTKLGAGTNFDGYTNDDSDARGQNGEGVTLTNIFSKEFRGYVQYKDTFVSVICKDNMDDIQITEAPNPGKPTGTTVQFLPDYARFGETHFSRDHQFMVMYYFAILSIQYPDVKFIFNGVQIKYTMDQLVQGLTHGKKSESELMNVDGLTVIVLPSNTYKFSQFINGSDANAGGNPIEWVTKKVVEGFSNVLPKKYQNIKPGQIESKLHIIALFNGMVKPRFEGQTKNKCITPYAQFSKNIDEKSLDWKAFGKKLFSNKKISDNIIIYHDIEAKALAAKEREGAEKERKGIRAPAKYEPANKENKYLIVAEGDAAVNSLMNNLLKSDKGYFPCGGKPANAYKKGDKISKNVELQQLFSPKILDLSFTKENTKMRYDNFVMAADADFDGIHITGLYIGFFSLIYPKMLIEKKFKVYQTPIVMSKNKRTDKTEKIFFTEFEYNEFVRNNPEEFKRLKHEYKKGLGSSSEEEYAEFFKMFNFDDCLISVYMRDPEIDPDGYMEDQKTLQNWLSEDTSFRKEAITNYLNQVTDIEKAHREKTITESLLLTVEGKPIDEPTGVEL